MERRRFSAMLVLVIGGTCAIARAQARLNPRRIGYLSSTTRAADSDVIAALVEALRERGWMEGANLRVEYRWASGNVGRLPELARELLRQQGEEIVAGGAQVGIWGPKIDTP